MQHHQSKPAPDVPKWSALLVEAVNKPGMIMEAYSAFHSYSIGNQILALVQCEMRGLEPGPINTFPGWQALGRSVKRGERALILCMPITRKVRAEYCRGYIQNWLCPVIGYNGDAIPEKSAQKIFRAADQILRAGRLQASENEQK